MTIRDGIGFNSTNSDSGRSKREIPKDVDDEGDGIKPSHRISTKIIAYPALLVLLYGLSVFATELVKEYGPVKGIGVFIAFLGFLTWIIWGAIKAIR